jgi:tetratricopeptide (TPR) repeat protein
VGYDNGLLILKRIEVTSWLWRGTITSVSNSNPDPAASHQSAHATGDSTIVQAGRDAVVTTHHHHVVGPALPYRAGAVPPRATSYQHRMLRLFDTSARTNVLVGLGGVGKTQLAADCAETLWAAREVDVLLWVNAASRESVVADYARAAVDLCGADDADPEHAARRLLAWLASTPTRWLVVLDDVQVPAHVSGLQPPEVATGKVLVTTRRRDAALYGLPRHVVEVGLFTEAESTFYLASKLEEYPWLAGGSAGLAADLGHLPLALAQAAAYVVDRSISCMAYQARFRDRRRTLESLLPDQEALPDDHRLTVATTWSLSIEYANQLSPKGVAQPLLQIASQLDPNGIPTPLFSSSSIQRFLATATGREIGAEDARDGLTCLHRLSLISLDLRMESRGVLVHALVQRAVHERIDPDRLGVVVRTAASALMEVWQAGTDTELAEVLRSNTDSLDAVAGELLWRPYGHDVLQQAARSLGESGMVQATLDRYKRLLVMAYHYNGPDHPDTLVLRNNIAHWRGRAGDEAGALSELEQLIIDQRRILGPNDRSTLTSRSNAAQLHGTSGDVNTAIELTKGILADQLRTLGPHDPDTLLSQNNLAGLRQEAGDILGATALYQELLDTQTRLFGLNHRSCLLTRASLASLRGMSGDAAGALEDFRALLSDRTQVLGPTDTDTLDTRNAIAYWLNESSDTTEAIKTTKALLDQMADCMDANHPDILTARENLIGFLRVAGDRTYALSAYQDLLDDCCEVLGPRHPHTRHVRANIARTHAELGDHARAIVEFTELLDDVQLLSGLDHPQAFVLRSDIAHWTGLSGDRIGAATAFRALYDDLLRVLGLEHHYTRAAFEHVHYWDAVD